MPTPWRLIYTPPARGSWNMAVDEALLESTRSGAEPPTLRLYSWEPACLSLGFAQSFGDVDYPRLQEHGWELVRRPTGGRAILHTDELTYSVTGPQDEPRLEGSVLESYRRLSQALLDALHQLNVPAESAGVHVSPAAGALANGADPKGPVCFEVPSDYEIVVGGKKLIGSAQARRKGGVLQHGSLPLVGDLSRIVQGLVFTSEPEREQAAERVLHRATTVETVLGLPISWEAAAEAIAKGFEKVLDLRLIVQELTPSELARAAALQKEKYDHDGWNKRLMR